jgi:hypothetical protein
MYDLSTSQETRVSTIYSSWPAIHGETIVYRIVWDEWWDDHDIAMYVTSPPISPTLDVGGDGDIQWSHPGAFTATERTPDFSAELNEHIALLPADESGEVLIPLVFYSETPGRIEISNINIQYFLISPLTITSPKQGETFTQGDSITFSCYGGREGLLLEWSSSIDGYLGEGNSFSRVDLSPGAHSIILRAKDKGVVVEEERVNITVIAKDVIPPTIHTITTSPALVYPDDILKITAEVTDNIKVGEVIAAADGFSLVLTHKPDTDLYEGQTTLPEPGVYVVRVTAQDTSGLVSSKQISITVNPIPPDLTLSSADISLSPLTASDGDSLRISATIHNKGVSNAENFAVELLIDGVSKQVMPLSVAGNSTGNVWFDWIAGFGNHTITIKADSGNVISEADETNNTAQKPILVIDKSPPVIHNLFLPELIYKGEPFIVKAEVTDNVGVEAVGAEVNELAASLGFNSGTGLYEVEVVVAEEGEYVLEVEAVDTSGLRSSRQTILTVKSPLPDLSLDFTDISIIPEEISEEDEVAVEATVHNNGKQDAENFPVELLIDGSQEAVNQLSVAGESAVKTQFSWIATYGDHTITIKADSTNLIAESDEANNQASRSIFVADITPPPAPVLTCEPSGWTTETTHIISWEPITDINGIARYEYRTDFGEWQELGTDTSFTTPPQSDGIHTVYVRAIDTPGNIGEAGSIELYIDRTPPNTPLIREWHCTDTWSAHSSPYFTWTDPGDIGSGVISYEASVDEQAPIDIGNVESYHPTWPSGEHTFKIQAVDATGHRSEWSNIITVYIDLEPSPAPVVSSPTHPDEDKWYADDSPRFSWDAPEDPSGISAYYYLLDRASSSIPTEISDWTKENTYLSSPLNEGIWYFHLVAKDGVGHIGKEPAHYRVKIDTTPPITIDDFINQGWHNEDISINLFAFDLFSGVEATYYRINDGPVKDVAVDEQPVITTEGPANSLEYWSVDNVGNEEMHYKITGIKLDKIPPDVEILSPVGGDVYIAKKSIITINFQVTDNLDPSPEVTSYLKDVERETIIDVVNGQGIDPLSIDDGFWTFTVKAKDWAGNTTSVTTEGFEVIHDIQPPRTTVTVGQPKYGTEPAYVSSSTSFTLTSVDDLIEPGDGIGLGVDYTEYKIDQEDWQRYIAPYTIPVEGDHAISYRSVDIVGNVEEIKSFAVCVDNTPPLTKDDFENESWYNSDITIILTATDNLSGVDRTYYTIADTQFTGNTITITEEGIYQAEYWSVDNLGNTEEPNIIPQIKLDKTPPLVYAGPDQVVNEGTEVVFDGSDSSDNLSGIVSYSWDFGDPADSTIGEGVKTKHTYGDNGEFTVILTVYDAADNSATDTAIVTVRNILPTITGLTSDAPKDEGSELAVSAEFTDPGWLDTHTATIDFGDGTILEARITEENTRPDASGTVEAKHIYGDNATYLVTLTLVDDDGGIDTETIEVTINNVPPGVMVEGAEIVDENSTAHFKVSFTDPGWLDTHRAFWNFGDETGEFESFVFEENDYPDATGESSWSHEYELPGVYTVVLKVIDDDEAEAVDTLKVTVQDAAPPNVKLISPSPENRGLCLIINGLTSIVGLANDVHTEETHPAAPSPDNFEWYQLSYAPGKNANDDWVNITDKIYTPFTEPGLMVTWDTTEIEQGYYTLRLVASEVIKPDNTTKPNTSTTKAHVYIGQPEVLFSFGKDIEGKDILNKPSYIVMTNLPDNDGPDIVKLPDGKGNFQEVKLEDGENILCITDTNNDRIVVYKTNSTLEGSTYLTDIITGEGQAQGKGKGAKDKVSNKPKGIVFKLTQAEDLEHYYDLNIYFADRNNNLVLKITPEEVIKLGIDLGFNKPVGLALDSEENLYIADRNNDRLVKLNQYGEIDEAFNSLVAEEVTLNKPSGLTVDSACNIYVADTNNDRVLKFDSEGNLVLVISEIFDKPMGVVINEQGYIYVSDTNNSVIKKFASSGNLVAEFILGLNKPVGLAFDVEGRLFIVDRNSNEIVVIGSP